MLCERRANDGKGARAKARSWMPLPAGRNHADKGISGAKARDGRPAFDALKVSDPDK